MAVWKIKPSIIVLNDADIDSTGTLTSDFDTISGIDVGDVIVGFSIDVSDLGGVTNWTWELQFAPADAPTDYGRIVSSTDANFGIETQTDTDQKMWLLGIGATTMNAEGLPILPGMRGRLSFNATPTDALAIVRIILKG